MKFRTLHVYRTLASPLQMWGGTSPFHTLVVMWHNHDIIPYHLSLVLMHSKFIITTSSTLSRVPHIHTDSSTRDRSLHTYRSSCYTSCGHTPAILLATSNKMPTNSSSLPSTCSTITLVARHPPCWTRVTVVASWTRLLVEGCSLMWHVKTASEWKFCLTSNLPTLCARPLPAFQRCTRKVGGPSIRSHVQNVVII